MALGPWPGTTRAASLRLSLSSNASQPLIDPSSVGTWTENKRSPRNSVSVAVSVIVISLSVCAVGWVSSTRLRSPRSSVCMPAPPLWRLCLSSSPLLLRSLLLWVWPAVEVPSPLLGLANTNFRLAKVSPFGSRAGRRECLNLACTYEHTASALPLSHLLRKLGWADDAT